MHVDVLSVRFFGKIDYVSNHRPSSSRELQGHREFRDASTGQIRRAERRNGPDQGVAGAFDRVNIAAGTLIAPGAPSERALGEHLTRLSCSSRLFRIRTNFH